MAPALTEPLSSSSSSSSNNKNNSISSINKKAENFSKINSKLSPLAKQKKPQVLKKFTTNLSIKTRQTKVNESLSKIFNKNNKDVDIVYNEQMGLKAALNNNNNQKSNNNNNKNKNNEEILVEAIAATAVEKEEGASLTESIIDIKRNSTDQLLADLTVEEFAEAVTVDISLHKQFSNVQLHKSIKKSINSSASKDILFIKSGKTANKINKVEELPQQHMESPNAAETQKFVEQKNVEDISQEQQQQQQQRETEKQQTQQTAAAQTAKEITEITTATLTTTATAKKTANEENIDKTTTAATSSSIETLISNQEPSVTSAVVENKENIVATDIIEDQLATAVGEDSTTAAAAAKVNVANENVPVDETISDLLTKVKTVESIEDTTRNETESPNITSLSVSPVHKKDTPATRLQNTTMLLELPTVNTDSTITASEVEDNLEERLSQLETTVTTQPISDNATDINSTKKTTDVTKTLTTTTTTTTPVTPTKQQLLPTQQQQIVPPNQLLSTPTSASSSSSISTTALASQQQHGTTTTNTLTTDGGTELADQDIEEVLKVLKGFDGTTGADTLGDLNVFFNEVYTSLNYDDINSQSVVPATTISTLNAGTTIGGSTSSALAASTSLREAQLQIEKKQFTMQRKIDYLLRRMRKLQARYMCKHTTEEIAGIFEWSSRVFGKGKGNSSSTSTAAATSIIAARPPASTWSHERRNSVPALTQVAFMLRRIESLANTQQMCSSVIGSNNNNNNSSTNLRKTKKAQDTSLTSLLSGGTTTTTATTSAAGTLMNENKFLTLVPNFDINVSEEMVQVTGLLQTEMREIQTSIDSDATASSSGGESADEMVTYGNHQQESLSIAKRAAWRFSRDRAAVASRWSWLLSQIADLEIKIRQHNDLQQEIIRQKGIVSCDTEYIKPKGVTGINATQSSVNGYKGDISTTATTEATLKDASDTSNYELNGCCRTRGFNNALFRKRKLLPIAHIQTISKKAARTTNIKCGCQWPLYPCALCTGRADPTAPRDLPDTMMMSERVALLDPGFHPILSFPEDISTSLHFEAIARLPDWQQRVMRAQVKSIAKNVWRAERDNTTSSGGGGGGVHQFSSSTNQRKFGETMIKRRYMKNKPGPGAGRGGGVGRPSNSKRNFGTTQSSSGGGGGGGVGNNNNVGNQTTQNDVGNGTNLSMPSTPLVADSKLLVNTEGHETHALPSSGRRSAAGTAFTNEQQQLHTSNERLSNTKKQLQQRSSIQSQPNTFIIDLQQQQQQLQ